ncbi:NETI protein [Halalkalibacter nanhaiisediminis]|uniref:NETI protein n=2 Tax=Halalkalibacter nanhaiisediminis TaxID=688079 RepID=A0A562QH10_9BACI|nr:NETI motif-containing protein [Halalkalibacter nanhaiisediminis]TWI56038.1 NETI protein [Halalkalibacter nanhaiisediminis]
MTKKRKLQFEVMESETIEECLNRMKKEGYQPVRRMEKPIFEERTTKSTKEYVPVRQQIVFEGILIEGEQ